MYNIFNLKSDVPLPKGLKIMAYGELLDRFTFYGTITLLTLYLTYIFHFSDHHLYEFWGLFAAFGFGLPVVGGILADRLLGFRFAINLGALFIILGALTLLISGKLALLFGLSAMVCGIGLYKGNVTGLVGLLYKDNDKHREQGFLVFYVFMVCGAILGPAGYGVCSELFGFRSGFILSALGFASFLVLFNRHYAQFAFKQAVKQLEKPPLLLLKKAKQYIFIVALVAVISVLMTAFVFPHIANVIFLSLSVLVFCLLLIYVCFKEKVYAGNVIVIGIISVINAIYFAAGIQVDGSLVLFMSRSAHYSILGFNVPPAAFSSLEPFFSVLFASSFMYCWNKLNIRDVNLNMIALLISGLALTALGFEFFAWGAGVNNHYRWLILWGVVLGNLAIALSGVCVLPTLMSSVTRLAPKRFLGTMVGMKYMINAAAGSLGAYIAELSGNSITHIQHSANKHLLYANTFHAIAVAVFFLSVLSLLLIPVIKLLVRQQSVV